MVSFSPAPYFETFGKAIERFKSLDIDVEQCQQREKKVVV